MSRKEDDKDLLKKYLDDPEINHEVDDKETINQILTNASHWKSEQSEDVESALNEFKSRIKSNPQKEAKQVTFNWVLRIAAVLVLGLGIGYFFLNQKQPIAHTTAKGERIEVTLPDQSKVFLDVESSLSYDANNWNSNRSLELNGKAFFDVEEGSDFSVISRNGTVRVLGTSFTINDRGDSYLVECYTGKVSVTNNTQEELLSPGEKVNLKNTTLKRSEIDIETTKGWISGDLSYQETNLLEVFEELGRQYNIEVVLETNDELIFSGSLNINQPHESNLERICLIMGLELYGENGRYVVKQPIEEI